MAYGGRAYGGGYYAQGDTLRTPPGGFGGGIGGSGFPRDWLRKMLGTFSPPDRDQQELEEILALGLLK